MMETGSTHARGMIEMLLHVHALTNMHRATSDEEHCKSAAGWLPLLESELSALRRAIIADPLPKDGWPTPRVSISPNLAGVTLFVGEEITCVHIPYGPGSVHKSEISLNFIDHDLAVRVAAALTAAIADPLPKDGEADRTLHEEVVSDARKLAHEINEDVMAGEDEIAAAIEAGFSFRERRLKARIADLERERDVDREGAIAAEAYIRSLEKTLASTCHRRNPDSALCNPCDADEAEASAARLRKEMEEAQSILGAVKTTASRDEAMTAVLRAHDKLSLALLTAALQPEPGTQGRVITPTTTDELDRALNSEDDTPIQVMPDGSVVPVDQPARGEDSPVSAPDFDDDYIDRLNTLCEKHGCIAGSDRLAWLDERLSASPSPDLVKVRRRLECAVELLGGRKFAPTYAINALHEVRTALKEIPHV